jgi:hypothetical protein
MNYAYSDKLIDGWSLFQLNLCVFELISCNDVEVGMVFVVVPWICPLSLTLGIRRPDEYSVSVI